MPVKIYLAGPMTGYDKFNFPAFDFWFDFLTQAGHSVFSPADNDRTLLGKSSRWMPTWDDQKDGWKAWNIPM